MGIVCRHRQLVRMIKVGFVSFHTKSCRTPCPLYERDYIQKKVRNYDMTPNLYQARENHAQNHARYDPYPLSSSRKPRAFFLSQLAEHNSKTIVSMRIFHIPNDFSATWHLPSLGRRGVRGTTGELRPRNCRLLFPKTLRVLRRRLLGLLFNCSGRGT